MRVVSAHNFYGSGQPSGENAVVAREARQLRAAGIDVLPLWRFSDEIPSLPLVSKLGAALGPVRNPQGVNAFLRVIDEFDPDLVHAHNMSPLLSPWVLRLAHQRGIATVHTLHNFRLDCAAGTYFRAGSMCRACEGTRSALPALRHGCYRGSRLQTLPVIAGRRFHRSTWLDVDRFMVLTPFHRRWLTDWGVAPWRIIVRPTSTPDPGEATPPGRDVLYAARLTPEKGVDLLLDAWEASSAPARGRRLRILGDGPMADMVARRARGNPTVLYSGSRDRTGVDRALQACGVVAIPSTCLEGLPSTLVEALAHSRGVLVSEVGGLAEIVTERIGRAVPPSVDGWREALDELDDVSIARWSVGARAQYEAVHSPDASIRSLLDTYGAALGGRQ